MSDLTTEKVQQWADHGYPMLVRDLASALLEAREDVRTLENLLDLSADRIHGLEGDRASIVAWLRAGGASWREYGVTHPDTPWRHYAESAEGYADAIERSEHLP